MPFAEATVADSGLDAESSSSRRSVLATVDRARPTRDHGFLGEAELLDELAVGVRLLDRVEVRALEVLDERELELLRLGQLADDGRNTLEARESRRPKPPLAGDEAIAIERLGDNDRLDDAVLAMLSARPRAPRRRSACAAGTDWRGSARGDLDLSAPWARALWDQSCKPPSEALLPLGRTVMPAPPAARPRAADGHAVAPIPRTSEPISRSTPVCLRSSGVGPVELDRETVAGRLGQPHASRNDGVEHGARRGGAGLPRRRRRTGWCGRRTSSARPP